MMNTHFEKSSEVLILCSKMAYLPHYKENNHFPPKKATTLLVFIETYAKNQKKITRQSQEKVTDGQTNRAEFRRLSARAGGTSIMCTGPYHKVLRYD